CGAKRHKPEECSGPAHAPTPRVPDQPKKAEARGGNLRLVENRGDAPQDPASGPGSRCLDVHLRSGCLQSGPNAKPDGGKRVMPEKTTRSSFLRAFMGHPDPLLKASHSRLNRIQLCSINLFQERNGKKIAFSAAC